MEKEGRRIEKIQVNTTLIFFFFFWDKHVQSLNFDQHKTRINKQPKTISPQIKKRQSYLCSFIWHNFICSEIRLVSNQNFVHIITSISINFIQPLLDVIEALFISHIINYLKKEPHRKRFVMKRKKIITGWNHTRKRNV